MSAFQRRRLNPFGRRRWECKRFVTLIFLFFVVAFFLSHFFFVLSLSSSPFTLLPPCSLDPLPFPPPSPAAHAADARLLSWFLDAPGVPFGVHHMALAAKMSACRLARARRRALLGGLHILLLILFSFGRCAFFGTRLCVQSRDVDIVQGAKILMKRTTCRSD